jgi:hypothetical protein
MSDGMGGDKATWMPHGEEDGHLPMTSQKLRRTITFKLELEFKQDYSHWKSLDEKKAMATLFEGFKEI